MYVILYHMRNIDEDRVDVVKDVYYDSVIGFRILEVDQDFDDKDIESMREAVADQVDTESIEQGIVAKILIPDDYTETSNTRVLVTTKV